MITRGSEHIQVEGHYGTWHVIDDGWYALTPDVNGEPKTYRAHCFLLEHDEYGDEAALRWKDHAGGEGGFALSYEAEIEEGRITFFSGKHKRTFPLEEGTLCVRLILCGKLLYAEFAA